MSGIKRIGIITSGGDCGGLNAVVYGVAQTCNHLGIEAVVIPNGYAGLYNLVDMEKLTVLNPQRADLVNIALAGSEAGHSRVKIAKIKDENKYERIKQGLEKHNIDALVISGGDDTGSVVADLKHHGFRVIHAPKTMDLDLQSYSVGGDSAINRIAEFVRDIQTTGRTHNRIMVIEVFGRYVGHTAFRGGVAGGADAILIPEIPVDFDVLYKHAKETYWRRIAESDVRAGTYTIVVAEGMKKADGEPLYDESAGVDAFGHKKLAGAGKYVAQEIQKRFKEDPETKELMKKYGMYVEGIYEAPEVRDIRPTHLVRSGFTSAYDVNFGVKVGSAAVNLLLQGIDGVSVVDVVGGEIKYIPVEKEIEQRYVELGEVALFEQVGICFGREPQKFEAKAVEVKDKIIRIY